MEKYKVEIYENMWVDVLPIDKPEAEGINIVEIMPADGYIKFNINPEAIAYLNQEDVQDKIYELMFLYNIQKYSKKLKGKKK